MGEWGIASVILNLSSQIHALATLSTGKEPLRPIALEKRKFVTLCQESNYDACVVQPTA
jgi:hypothetical protein